MPRLPRIRLEGAIYYVTARGLQGEPIFKDKDDYKMYLELVSKYKSQHKFKLFSYNLLPERLELLIETGDDATISDIMHDLNSLYTKYFNGRYQKRGHLFESRFRSVLVEKANHLLAMTRHIHLKDAENPYSSFRIYMRDTEPVPAPGDLAAMNMDAEIKEVTAFLKNKDDAKAYERYVLAGDAKEIDELEKGLRRGQVLGSEAFQQQVKDKVQEQAEQKDEAAPVKTNVTFIVMAGALVLLATASAVYLYVGKKNIENEYSVLLKQKEQEFAEKTKFENRSPLALSELEGTRWEIEAVLLPADKAQGALKDTLHFVNGQFYSEEYSKQGFKPSNISVTRQPDGVVTWETLQSNAKGDAVSWRGDWQGDVMKGIFSVTPAGQKPRDFSFFSVKWSYAEGGVR